jgi:hypothetical protein
MAARGPQLAAAVIAKITSSGSILSNVQIKVSKAFGKGISKGLGNATEETAPPVQTSNAAAVSKSPSDTQRGSLTRPVFRPAPEANDHCLSVNKQWT